MCCLFATVICIILLSFLNIMHSVTERSLCVYCFHINNEQSLITCKLDFDYFNSAAFRTDEEFVKN